VSHFKGSRKGAWAVVLGLGLAAAPALAEVTVTATDRIQLHAGSRVIEAKVQGDRIFGSEIQIQRYGDEVRGRAFNAPIRLGFEQGRVTGSVGSAPVRLNLSQAEQSVTARGLFAGQQSDLRVDATSITGRIGRCDYDLTLAGTYYSGFRTCGGASVPIPTTLEVPEGLTDYPEGAKVAVLSLVLAGR
jgi:hypothetical protein